MPDINYTKEVTVGLNTTDAELSTPFNVTEIANVQTEDGDYVSLSG